jgi:toxin ParE1/3/4
VRLRWLPTANADLVSILNYITRQSGNTVIGRRFVQELQRKCRELANLPGKLGRPRSELRPDLRSYAHKGYVIFFRYEPGVFEVVNIIEGHRDIDARSSILTEFCCIAA